MCGSVHTIAKKKNISDTYAIRNVTISKSSTTEFISRSATIPAIDHDNIIFSF
jgi:hypothetical protein